MIACEYGHTEIAKMLYESGADPSIDKVSRRVNSTLTIFFPSAFLKLFQLPILDFPPFTSCFFTLTPF
jgi:hypothetical protein